MRIAICGCMMQQPEVAEHIKKRFDFVDIVFGSHNTHSLPKLLFESLMENERQFEIIVMHRLLSRTSRYIETTAFRHG